MELNTYTDRTIHYTIGCFINEWGSYDRMLHKLEVLRTLASTDPRASDPIQTIAISYENDLPIHSYLLDKSLTQIVKDIDLIIEDMIRNPVPIQSPSDEQLKKIELAIWGDEAA